jgi:glycosyltransferase involved in cell wall biosynthesis
VPPAFGIAGLKILLVTDAWQPQAHGVVTALLALVRQLVCMGHDVQVIQPGQFLTRRCPGFRDIALAIRPGPQMARLLDQADADAIHIATEGPLGWAARRHCLHRGWPFTTAFHTPFPEILQSALGLPLSWGYAVLKRFHAASHGLMVPSASVQAMLAQRGFKKLLPWTQGVDTRLFAMSDVPAELPSLGPLARPISLCVSRIAADKNIEDFLSLDIPGSKLVCGQGPLEESLRARYPNVHWLGMLPRHELAKVYATADVLVFPARSDTFGLVMLEAMSCGVPVAAYPVNGPRELLGDGAGGAMDEDLHEAWRVALRTPRRSARQRALQYSWGQTAALFVGHLVPLRRGARETVTGSLTGMSRKRHAAVE